MNNEAYLTLFSVQIAWIDAIAFVWFFLCWLGYTAFAESARRREDNLLSEMNIYRLNWMRQMLKRQNRMMDETAIGNLLRSVSFFASTSILILAGVISLFGYSEKALDVLETIPFAAKTAALMFEIKLALLALIFIYAFFKYTWSLRQYNYATILVGAAPQPEEQTDIHELFAQHTSRLLTNAARHFSMGLRAYYFGMAALAWFIHPLLFIIGSAWVVIVLYRREFRSYALECIRPLRELVKP